MQFIIQAFSAFLMLSTALHAAPLPPLYRCGRAVQLRNGVDIDGQSGVNFVSVCRQLSPQKAVLATLRRAKNHKLKKPAAMTPTRDYLQVHPESPGVVEAGEYIASTSTSENSDDNEGLDHQAPRMRVHGAKPAQHPTNCRMLGLALIRQQASRVSRALSLGLQTMPESAALAGAVVVFLLIVVLISAEQMERLQLRRRQVSFDEDADAFLAAVDEKLRLQLLECRQSLDEAEQNRQPPPRSGMDYLVVDEGLARKSQDNAKKEYRERSFWIRAWNPCGSVDVLQEGLFES